jgi:peptidoglycan/LPS O-acetylase OafA/YrhL
MKKSYLAILISLAVLITSGFWFYQANFKLSMEDILTAGVIALLVLFGLYVGYSRLRSEKRGQPAEDELSKKILLKAAATSYFISLYLWLVIMYIGDKKKYDFEVLTGSGILGMGILFACSWLFYHFRGLRDE